MKKKLLSIVVSISIMSTLLIGCGSKSTTSDSPVKSDDTSTTSSEVAETEDDTTAEDTTANESSSEDVTINYYTWYQSSDGSYPANMIDAFEKKYPNIKINLEVGSQNVDEYLEMQKVKLLSGKDIDVTSVRKESYTDYVAAGYLKDITGESCLDNYNDDYKNLITVDGKIYGIPYAMDVYGCIYNKTMFEKNGWEVPTNYESFQKLCTDIASTGVNPTVQGYKDSWPLAQDMELFMNPIVVDDPDIYNKIDSGTAKYTDQEFVDAITKMNEFFHSDAISQQNMALTYDQAASSFATGQSAMMMHGEWVMDSITNANPDFEIGVCAAPLNENGNEQRGVVAITSAQCIAATSEHPKEAQLFLDYMSSSEGATYMDEGVGNFTSVSGVSSDKLDLWKDVLSLPSTDFFTDYMYTGVSSEMYKDAQQMINDQMTPEEMCTAMQSAQDKK